MSVYKTHNHIVKTCKFRFHTDIEKNPGPSLLLIDPWKTIKAPHSQGNELVLGQNVGQQCLPTIVDVFDSTYQFRFSESYSGTLGQETYMEGYQYCMSLKTAFESLISENYTSFILPI
ncbi:unnamed protein product [Porites evermanni]|uniref:Uncharacterized protein n=1 Tax=Porites evermanni TaxID=104178 RepID=A0ABN8R055_9CNID|nr:unnamed protein product [Porites evermanni]